jgi:molecular chaperone DnaK
LERRLTMVDTVGRDACATKNQRRWSVAKETLTQLTVCIEKIINPRAIMDIGIDLGPAFSVMAVKGPERTAPGYPPGKYLGDDGLDVTILPDLAGNYTIPSVFWWEPDPSRPREHSKGTYAFGWEARLLAAKGKSPLMVSTHSVGTNEKMRLNGRAFTTKEVVTRFLCYLKQCAETVTGQAIGRAVITYPANFSRGTVQGIWKAAKEAGFTMEYPQQMLMDPVAATLACTSQEPRGINPGDSLRLLIYDLGGATFDVAVVEKNENVIQVKSFDGDHRLGGSNFDGALVQWILDQLKAQSIVIPTDDKNEDQKGYRTRLLQVAESVKIKLTDQRTPKVKVPVKVDFLFDDEGQPLQFRGSINQEEYAALIQEDLRKTIACCRRALATANLAPADLHAVLLVGESSYGPWVQEIVNKEFGQPVELVAPDLCVAAGAALMVAQLPAPSPMVDPAERMRDDRIGNSMVEDCRYLLASRMCWADGRKLEYVEVVP